ncbi:MAG TPA: SdrD B-like domain-containing protein [Candidatus Limiplasma sp.]|nr:SdrD B-like domain-containing protein [Candidatus Limiplasma sp.]
MSDAVTENPSATLAETLPAAEEEPVVEETPVEETSPADGDASADEAIPTVEETPVEATPTAVDVTPVIEATPAEATPATDPSPTASTEPVGEVAPVTAAPASEEAPVAVPAGIMETIANQGYAYVLTADHKAGLYSGAGMNTKQRVGTVYGKNVLLCATDYVERDGKAAAVLVWFVTDDGVMSGYLSEARLQTVVVNNELAKDTVADSGCIAYPWSYHGMELILSSINYTPAAESAETAPENTPAGPTDAEASQPADEATLPPAADTAPQQDTVGNDNTNEESDGQPQDSESPEVTETPSLESMLAVEPDEEPGAQPDGQPQDSETPEVTETPSLESLLTVEPDEETAEQPQDSETPEATETVADESALTTGAAVIAAENGETALYSAANEASDALLTLYNGTDVEVLSIADAWAYVQFDDFDLQSSVEGYVPVAALTNEAPDAQTDQLPEQEAAPVLAETPVPETSGISDTATVEAVAGETILYSQASADADVLLTLANGTALVVLSMEDDWALVQFSDADSGAVTEGYVLTADLVFELADAAPAMASLFGSITPLDAGAAITFEFTSQDGKAEFLTGETAVFNVLIDASGIDASQTLHTPTARITIPNAYIDTLSAPDISSAIKTINVDTAAGVTTIDYTFSSIPNGSSFLIPIVLTTKPYDTPGNYALVANAQLLDAQNTELYTASLTTTWKVVQPNMTKCMVTDAGNLNGADGGTYLGGTADPNDSTLISTDGAYLKAYQYYMGINNGLSNASLGKRRTKKIIITDVLPEGAVFDAAANPGWTQTSATTVTYVYDKMLYYYTNGSYTDFLGTGIVPTLKLKFPGASTATTFTNSATITYEPDNGQDYEDVYTATDSITFKLKTGSYSGTLNKAPVTYYFDSMLSKTANREWYFTLSNPAVDLNLENVVLEDFNLDDRLDYASLAIQSPNGSFAGTVSYTAIDGNGNETVFASSIPSTDHTAYPVPAGTVRLRISTDEGSYLLPSSTINILLHVKMTDPENTHATGDQSVDNFTNSVSYTANYEGFTDVVSATTRSTMQFLPYNPVAVLRKSTAQSSITNGSTCTWSAIYYAGTSAYDQQIVGESIVDVTLVDILPPGLEYVAGSTTKIADNSSALTNKEPQIIENYKNTGNVALVWHCNDSIYAGTYPGNAQFGVYFNTIATRDMEEGTNINNAYLIWDNNGTGTDTSRDQISAYNGVADTYDLDNDGNTSEMVAKATAPIEYVPPQELYGTKLVKGGLDSGYMLSTGTTEIGGAVSYQLAITNKSPRDISSLVALEVLPHTGDYTIAFGGGLVPRGSEFPVYLTGPVTGPAGYTIYYTTHDHSQGGSPGDYAAESGWTTSVSDYSAMRGIKIIMNAGTVLPTEETVTFTVPAAAVDDMTLTSDMYANNTFAVSQNGTEYLEANARRLHTVTYQVSGKVFVDQNQDSIYNTAPTAERLLANVPVSLQTADGTPVLDLDGNPITGVTDADGNYSFTIYHAGTYRVLVDTPSSYNTTAPGDDSNENASQLVSGMRYTSTFTVSQTDSAFIRNAGLTQTAEDVAISKTLLASDGTAITDKRDFYYTIQVGDALFNGEVRVNGVRRTITNGALTFQNGDTVQILSVPIGATYVFTETGSNLANYTVTVSKNGAAATQSSTVSGTVSAGEAVAFTNQEKANGALTITKVLKNESGVVVNDTSSFPITVTGPSYPSGTAFTLVNGTPLVLQNLIYGAYSVTESNADAYTVTISGPATLSVGGATGTITVTNEKKPTAALSIKKTTLLTDARAGEDIPYTIVVTNSGLGAATGVKVTETLPANATYKSSNTANGSYDPATNVWNIGNIAPGSSATLNLVLTVAATAVDGDIVHNAAAITEEGGTPQTGISYMVDTPVKNPSLTIDKSTTQTVTRAGADIPYTVTVTNTGLGVAKSVKVTETLPANATFKSATPYTGTYNAVTNIWSIGDIAAGGSASMTLVLTVAPGTMSGAIVHNLVTVTEENATPQVGPSDTVDTPVQNPVLSITKTTTATQVRAGEDIPYTITVTNSGTGVAKAVKMSDILPANATHKSATPSAGTYNSLLSLWNIGDIAPGGSATLNLVLTVAASAQNGDTVHNVASVTEENGSSLAEPLTADATTPVMNPVLAISKTASIMQVRAGGDITYTIKVTNSGLGVAKAVQVTETLPANATFKSASATSGAYDAATHIWSIGDIAASGSATLTLVLTASTTAVDGDIVTNTATVSQENGKTPENPPTDSVDTVVNNPTLTVLKNTLQPQARAGDDITYTITVSNDGLSIANNVKLTDTFPTNATYKSYNATKGSFNPTTGVWSVGNIAAGGNATLTLVLTASPSAASGDIVRNVVAVTEENGSAPTIPSTDDAETLILNPDLAIDKSTTQTLVRAGEDISYTVTVTNNGLGTAKAVKVMETLPANASFKSATPARGNYNAATRIWSIGDIAPGASATMTMVLTASQTAQNGDTITNVVTVIEENGATLANPPTDDAVIPVRAPVLTVVKSSAQAQVRAGENITFTVTVTNSGLVTAKSVKLTDTLPTNATYISATPSNGTYAPSTRVWTIGDIAPSASATMTMVMKVSDTAVDGDHVTNVATVTEENGALLAVPPTDEASVPVANPNVSIVKSTTQTRVNSGEDITYTIQVTNQGLGVAKAVKVTETLPANATFKSAAPASGTYNSTTNVWSVGDIASGATVSMTLVLTVSAEAQNGDTVTNTVAITEENGTTLVDPPTDEVVTPVLTAILSIEKSTTQTQARAGEDITYTITVTNSGQNTARAVMVTEIFPTNATFKSATPSTGTYNPTTHIWSVGDIAPATNATMTVVLTTDQTAQDGDTVTNVATITQENGVPPNEPPTDTIVTPIANPDLAIVKTANRMQVHAGDDIQYTITVTNNGLGTAKAVMVSETLPTNATFKSATPAVGTYDATTNIWSVGDIAPGANATMTVILTASATAQNGDTITNAVTVTGENGVTLTTPPTDDVVTPVTVSMLDITKTTAQTQVRAGEDLTYTVTVTNEGTSIARSVKVAETLPSNVTFKSATPTAGVYNTTTHEWAVGDIAVGQSVTMQLVVTVATSAKNGDIVHNLVSITEADGSLLSPKPSASRDTPVRNPLLTITKTAAQTSTQPGSDITYTIRVANSGTGIAKGVVVTETLPTNATFKSAKTASGVYRTATNTWQIGDIPAGKSVTLALVLTTASSAVNGDRVLNIASITKENGVPLTQSITASATVPVLLDGQLTITKILLSYDGATVTTARTFVVKVTGPSYPSGTLMEITNANPLVLKGLLYGKYQVEELNAVSYTVTISGAVTLSQNSKQGSISVQNQEKDKSLPVTGEDDTPFILAGALIALSGIILMVLNRRKSRLRRG